MINRMVSFAEAVRKSNEYARRRTIVTFLCSLFLPVFLAITKATEDGGSLVVFDWGDLNFLLPSLAILLFTDNFYRQYTLQCEPKDGIDLGEIVGVHAFSVENYFAYIRKKALKFEIILFLTMFLASCFTPHRVIYIGITLLTFVAVWAVENGKKVSFEKRMTQRKRTTGASIWAAVCRTTISWASMMLAIPSGCLFGICVMVACSLNEAGFPKGEIVERVVGSYGITVAILMGFTLAALGPILFENKKVGKPMTFLGLFAGVLGIILSLVSTRFWYYEINYSQRTISIVHLDQKENYEFSDVETYTPYNEEDEDNVYSLTLKDGTVLKPDVDGSGISYNGDYQTARKECFK